MVAGLASAYSRVRTVYRPEADSESFLSSFSIAQAIDAVDEFLSADSSFIF